MRERRRRSQQDLIRCQRRVRVQPAGGHAYSTTDPNFPGGGEATYEGATVARAGTTYYDRRTVEIGVTWEANQVDVTWAALGHDVGNITRPRSATCAPTKGALYATDQ